MDESESAPRAAILGPVRYKGRRSGSRAGRLARSSPVDYIARKRPPLAEACFAARGHGPFPGNILSH
jgi:hypothetical protein